MQETTNLDLELYEATDNANLMDGYNNSMRKIDTHVGTQDGLITLAQNTANTASTAATAAAADASTALSTATTAASTATSAATAADAAQATADSINATLTQFMAQPFADKYETLSGTTSGGNTWSCECHTFQFGTGTHPLQITEIRGRTLAVTFSSGPSGLYYGTGAHIIPNIGFPQAYIRTTATVENCSGEAWLIKEAPASETATASANVVKSVNPSSALDIYWSIIAIGLASAPLS